ncbi:hypothetical protein [Rubinisphaera sp.]|uniref:hypothetical protein n=1 Tax=Rubinisphaera sp. TaxID=2024857 RepID=UPI000C1109BF|nr:hypothetical protein [Rubinisphaera sp.]MBV09066.1 hypothetical protein [Rubinisphaera sp.]|tara:strand:+ start:3017 stop:3217 length:201 start_codon:yes stop_codon:yes gene_type:complete
MKLDTIVALVLVGGLILMAVGNALKNRGSGVGAVIETIGKGLYLLWAGAVVLLVVALIWLAFQFSR